MKKLVFLALAAIMLVPLSACAADAATNGANGAGTPATAVGNGSNGEATTVGSGSNGEAQNDGSADAAELTAYGEIGEIYGNYLVLKIIEGGPRMFNGQRNGGEMPEGAIRIDPSDFQNLTEEELKEKYGDLPMFNNNSGEAPVLRSGDGTRQFNGTPPEGGSWGEGMPEGGTWSGELPEGAITRDGAAVPGGMGRMPVNYTGEEKEVVIPVGVPIVSISYGEGGAEESAVKLETLKAGDTILVAYAEDGESVTKVTVMPSGGTMRTFGGNADGATGTFEFNGEGTVGGSMDGEGNAVFYMIQDP